MRVFIGLVGGLFLLVGVVGGLIGVLSTGNADTDGSWECTSRPNAGEQSSTQSCSFESAYNPVAAARQRDVGIDVTIAGASVFVGGCALIGGAVAGGRKAQQQRTYAPQPVAPGGPPSYGGGWQGNQQPPAGNEPPRS